MVNGWPDLAIELLISSCRPCQRNARQEVRDFSHFLEWDQFSGKKQVLFLPLHSLKPHGIGFPMPASLAHSSDSPSRRPFGLKFEGTATNAAMFRFPLAVR